MLNHLYQLFLFWMGLMASIFYMEGQIDMYIHNQPSGSNKAQQVKFVIAITAWCMLYWSYIN
jgi:hypothetical protein